MVSSKSLTSPSHAIGTLKAIGIVAAIGVLGVGTVVVIQGIRQLGTDRDRGSMVEVTGGDAPSLRDRVRVIKPQTQAPSNQDNDADTSTKPRSQRLRQPVGADRIGYGFGNGPGLAPSDQDDVAADELSDELPEDTLADTEEPTDQATKEQMSPPSVADQASSLPVEAEPNADTAIDRATLKTTIAALLRPLLPLDVTPVALKPRPVPAASPIVITLPSGEPARPLPPPVAATTAPSPRPTVVEPTVSTQPPVAVPSPNLTSDLTGQSSPPSSQAPPLPLTLPTGAPQPLTTLNPTVAAEGVYVGQLQITGSTQFPLVKLAEAVQSAIASNPDTAKQPDRSSNPTSLLEPSPAPRPSPSSPPSPAASSDAVDQGNPLTLNRMVTVAELLRASEAITKLYIDNGYINSGAYVPAEVLNGAPPEIRVIEGRVESIAVQVTPAEPLWFGQPLSPGYVEQRLSAAIRSPLRLEQLLDTVKLLEQDPLIDSISTELAPGTTTGGSILNVAVKQAPALSSNLSVSNSRSPSVGQLEQQVDLSQANLLGWGDTLKVAFRRTEGSSDWSINYSVPITPQNGTLSLGYTTGSGRIIEAPFQVLDIRSNTQNYEIGFRQPLVQTSTEAFAVSFRVTHYINQGLFLDAFNNGTPLPFPANGADADGTTRVTALRFGQDWIKRGDRDVISLQSEFSYGLDALGATALPFPPDSRFISWQGQGFWVHSFAPDTLLALRGKILWSDRPLVPSEQISLGGADTIRGYRPSTFLADNGWFLSTEAYLPILRVPEWQGLLQVIPFFDVGQGWNNSNDQPNPNSLMSVGLGLQWKMGNSFRARLDWGVPLINASPNGQSLEQNLFFSIIFSP